jgi:hypothetical protein
MLRGPSWRRAQLGPDRTGRSPLWPTSGSLSLMGVPRVCDENSALPANWWNVTVCFEISPMWSTLSNRLHICKSFKSCWIKGCYRPPTKPRSALSETGPLWCATPCGNISVGWNCEPVKNATARATRDRRKLTRKRRVGNRRPRGRKNSPRHIPRHSPRHIPRHSPRHIPRRSTALPVRRARQETTGPRAHPQQCHRLFIHSHGCSCHFHNSRRTVGSRSERGGRHEVPVRGKSAQCSYGVATAPGETCGPA